MAYIDKDKALEICEKHYQHCLEMHDYCGDSTADNIKEDIERLPTADVVEVVRCRDCLFSHKDYDYKDGYACEKPLYHPQIGERPHRKLMQGCDYCSFGVCKPPERSDAE